MLSFFSVPFLPAISAGWPPITELLAAPGDVYAREAGADNGMCSDAELPAAQFLGGLRRVSLPIRLSRQCSHYPSKASCGGRHPVVSFGPRVSVALAQLAPKTQVAGGKEATTHNYYGGYPCRFLTLVFKSTT